MHRLLVGAAVLLLSQHWHPQPHLQLPLIQLVSCDQDHPTKATDVDESPKTDPAETERLDGQEGSNSLEGKDWMKENRYAARGLDDAPKKGTGYESEEQNHLAEFAETAARGGQSAEALTRLVREIKEAATVAAEAVGKVETVLRNALLHNHTCEIRAHMLSDEINASTARLQLASETVAQAPEALASAGEAELVKFENGVAGIEEAHGLAAISRRQQDIISSIAALKKAQEATTSDLMLLHSSYRTLEGTTHEKLKRLLAAAEETARTSYSQMAEHLKEMMDWKVAKIQQHFNTTRLDDLAAERAIVDITQQLKAKGAAVVDISDIFADHGFETARKEFVARLARRIKAFFLPIFVVTQTPAEFSEWLYTRHHIVPSMRTVENIVDELNFTSDPKAYAVVRVENLLTDVIIRRPNPSSSGSSGSESEDPEDLALESLVPGRTVPIVSQPSHEALLMPLAPFFGSEMVKRFEALTRADVQSAVGNLAGRAILLIFMGDRKGEIAMPKASARDVARKLDFANKLFKSFSAPSQELTALWRQMDLEQPFYATVLKEDPVIVSSIPVSICFEPAQLPPLPPSPLFRGEFGIIQIQALRRGSDWLVPLARALHPVIAYVNNHPQKGGVQGVLRVVARRVNTFWKTQTLYRVAVSVMDADGVPEALHLARHVQTESGKPDTGRTIVALASARHVKEYLVQALSKSILPAIAPRATFKRLIVHICEAGATC